MLDQPLAQGGVECLRSFGIAKENGQPSLRAAHTRDRSVLQIHLVICGVGDVAKVRGRCVAELGWRHVDVGVRQ